MTSPYIDGTSPYIGDGSISTTTGLSAIAQMRDAGDELKIVAMLCSAAYHRAVAMRAVCMEDCPEGCFVNLRWLDAWMNGTNGAMNAVLHLEALICYFRFVVFSARVENTMGIESV